MQCFILRGLLVLKICCMGLLLKKSVNAFGKSHYKIFRCWSTTISRQTGGWEGCLIVILMIFIIPVICHFFSKYPSKRKKCIFCIQSGKFYIFEQWQISGVIWMLTRMMMTIIKFTVFRWGVLAEKPDWVLEQKWWLVRTGFLHPSVDPMNHHF